MKFYSCFYKLLCIFSVPLITRTLFVHVPESYSDETSLQIFFKLSCKFFDCLCQIIATCFSVKLCGDSVQEPGAKMENNRDSSGNEAVFYNYFHIVGSRSAVVLHDVLASTTDVSMGIAVFPIG